MIKNKTQVKKDLFFRFISVFAVFFVVIQVFLANSLSVQGKEISRLNSLKADLNKEIENLEHQSSNLSSLENVRRVAFEKLQMVGSFESFDYLTTSFALR